MRKSLAITGAGSGVGKSLAYEFEDRDDLDLDLIGGRREAQLKDVGNAVGARDVIPGNLFQAGSTANRALIESRHNVVALIAAINLDTHPVVEEREQLREEQNALLQEFLEALKHNDPNNPRLVVDMNSVTQYFARENAKAAGFPYMKMKMQQADIISAARNDLKTAGVEIVVISAGAIRTEMMSHILDDERAVKMANMFGGRMKNVPGHPEGIVQDRMFQTQEVAKPIADLINAFLAHGEIPPQYREWLMAHSSDLQFIVA